MTKLHNLLKQVVNSKETRLNESKNYFGNIWLCFTWLVFFISMVACAPTTFSDDGEGDSGDGGNGGNQPNLTDLGLALTGFQINGKDKAEMIYLLAGKDLNIVAQVKNQGKNEYQGTVTYYQSVDDEISTNDTSLDSTIFSLVGGRDWDEMFALPSPDELGTYYYGACVSFQDQNGVNQVTCTPAIQVVVRNFLENVFNVDDSSNINLELEGAFSITTAQVGETTYLFTAGWKDDGVSVFSVANDGSLINITNVGDAGNLELDGAISVTTAQVGETTYLFIAGQLDHGVSVFNVANDGSLSNVFNVGDAGNLELEGANSVTTAEVEGTTYLFIAGIFDHGISVFNVANDGSLNNVFNVDDSSNINLKLDKVYSVTTAIVEGDTYLFTAGSGDDGISVFKVANDGSLNNVDNVGDDDNLKLDRVYSVTTAMVETDTYLFTTGSSDDGISMFNVDPNNGSLSNVYNITDDSNLELDGAFSATTAVVGATPYLFTTGSSDDGVSVFRIEDNGKLNNVANVDDSDDSDLNLLGARSVTTAVVGGTTYLFTTGFTDNGVSVFKVNGE